jgi:Flp pilus assembly protein TadD
MNLKLLVVLVVVFATVVLVHWPALSARANGFDDGQYFAENDRVRYPTWAGVGAFLSEVLDPSTVEGYYQPLTMISLMIDTAAGGTATNLRPYHWTNLVSHALNALLVVLIAQTLFRSPIASGFAGLLFGLHPLMVDSVYWISERKTLLATFFSFVAMLSYFRFARTRSWLAYTCCLLAYVLALMSKPTSLPLPAALLLFNVWPLRRLSWRAAIETIPLFVLCAVSAVVTYLSQAKTYVGAPSDYGLTGIPLVLAYDISFYLTKLVWPTHLTIRYPPPSPISFSNWQLVLSLVAMLGLAALCVRVYRRSAAPLVALGLFFVLLTPSMQVVSVTDVLVSNKYAYLPLIGPILLIAAGCAWLIAATEPACPHAGRRSALAETGLRTARLCCGVGPLIRGSVVVLSVTSLVALSLASRSYGAYWSDTVTLFRPALALAPDVPMLHYHLGFGLKAAGDEEGAMACFREAYRLDNTSPQFITNLANQLHAKGDIEGALKLLNEALAADPEYQLAHYNLAFILSGLGRRDEAAVHYQELLRLAPNDARANNNFGLMLAEMGDTAGAIEHIRKAIERDPKYIEARLNLASVLFDSGNHNDARTELEEVLRQDPENAKAHAFLGAVLAMTKNFAPAIDHFRAAVRLLPTNPEAHFNLAHALAESGQDEEAIAQYREALRLAPEDKQIAGELDALLARSPR